MDHGPCVQTIWSMTPIDIDAWVRLAWSGQHPQKLRSMTRDAGGPAALVEMVESGRSSMSESGRRAVSVPLERRMEQLSEVGIELVTLGANNYPPELADIPDSPTVLFLRGQVPTRPRVAVVGSRKASPGGLRMAREVGEALAVRGVSVVSGLALGVDAEAHRGMLSGRGGGIAVVATGPDVWYPAAHRQLGEDIVASGGAIVSEYPPGTGVARWRFPLRNRLITGLSGVVLVVEATEKSGTMIAVRYARQQGRTLMAVPGSATHANARGCDLLIERGAIPVSEVGSLLEQIYECLNTGGRAALPF